MAVIIGVNAGRATEQKYIQNEIKEVMGDMMNIARDGNEVIINNNIKELLDEYQNTKTLNVSLAAQNVEYINDLAAAN